MCKLVILYLLNELEF